MYDEMVHFSTVMAIYEQLLEDCGGTIPLLQSRGSFSTVSHEVSHHYWKTEMTRGARRLT
jgi:hypothetical protein